MTSRKYAAPAAVDPGVVLIDVFTDPDELGRQQFAAYRADSNQWRGGNGVAGQISCTRLDEFAAREREHGSIVLRMTEHSNEPVTDRSAR